MAIYRLWFLYIHADTVTDAISFTLCPPPHTKTDTCYAMKDIADQFLILQRVLNIYYCYVENDCTKVNCEVLELILQPCYSPPAIQLKIEDDSAIYMFHTFTKSEAVSVTMQDTTIAMKITLDHLEDAIGLQVSIHVPSRGAHVQHGKQVTSGL